MKQLISLRLLGGIAGAFLSFAVMAAPGTIKIISPANNAVLSSTGENDMTYEVNPGDGGDHFHVWVDDDRGPAVHSDKGVYVLPPMAPGEHTVTVKIVDKGHVPTGPSQTIKVMVR